MTILSNQKQHRSKSNNLTSLRADLQQQLLARHMLMAGYVTHIVQIETALSSKKIRLIMKGLVEEGFPDNKRSRASRSSKTLMCNQVTKLHASMLMSIYRKYGGEEVFSSIDITALAYAYKTYISIFKREDLSLNMIPNDGLFEISDAWFLAKELRCREAMFLQCKQCHCTYFSTVHEGRYISCPFCSERKLALRRKNARNDDDFEPVVDFLPDEAPSEMGKVLAQ